MDGYYGSFMPVNFADFGSSLYSNYVAAPVQPQAPPYANHIQNGGFGAAQDATAFGLTPNDNTSGPVVSYPPPQNMQGFVDFGHIDSSALSIPTTESVTGSQVAYHGDDVHRLAPERLFDGQSNFVFNIHNTSHDAAPVEAGPSVPDQRSRKAAKGTAAPKRSTAKVNAKAKKALANTRAKKPTGFPCRLKGIVNCHLRKDPETASGHDRHLLAHLPGSFHCPNICTGKRSHVRADSLKRHLQSSAKCMQVALVVYAEEEEAANNVEMLRFLVDALRRSQELPEEDKLLSLRSSFDRYCEQRKCAIDAFRLRPRCKFPSP